MKLPVGVEHRSRQDRDESSMSGKMRRPKSAWDGLPMRPIRSQKEHYDQVPLLSSDDESVIFEGTKGKRRRRRYSGVFQNFLLSVLELPAAFQR